MLGTLDPIPLESMTTYSDLLLYSLTSDDRTPLPPGPPRGQNAPENHVKNQAGQKILH